MKFSDSMTDIAFKEYYSGNIYIYEMRHESTYTFMHFYPHDNLNSYKRTTYPTSVPVFLLVLL